MNELLRVKLASDSFLRLNVVRYQKFLLLNFCFDSAVCNQRAALLSEVCSNPECATSVNPGISSSSIKTQYELGISLSDHTGTIDNCRLSEKCAEDMCGCKVSFK